MSQLKNFPLLPCRKFVNCFLSRIKLGNVGPVPDPSKGVCADPVNGAAILGKGGPDPRGGNKERQLSPDKGREM
jgi:hypothetical protein